MNAIVSFFTLSKVGLISNFIGTVMVAISFGKNLADAHQINKKGKKIYLASFIHPYLFYIGLFLLAVGFLLQLF